MSQSSAGKSSLKNSSEGGQIPGFLANFIKYSFDAIVAYNSNRQVIYWNPAAERMFGWKANEALGKKPGELYGAGYGEQGNDLQQMQFPSEPGRTSQGESLLHRKDGSSFWVEYQLHMSLDEDTHSPIYVAVYRDITEQKHTEQALHENEQRFLSMADAAPVMIWTSGTDKLCTWFNQPWLDFVGREMEQELGDGWTENVHPDDLERCLETYSTAFDARLPFRMEYRLKRRDGQYRWLLDNGIPTYGPGNEFTGYIGSCIDITAQKSLEEALRKSEERFSKAFQASPNALVISRMEDGLIETVNDTFVEFFGYSREEALGKTSIQLGMFANPADRQEAIHELQKHGFVRDFELDVRLKSGEIRIVSLSAELINVSDKTMMLTTIQDTTEQKRAEAQLEQNNQWLNEVLDSIQDDFYVLNRDWVFVYASRLFTSRIGKEPKDFVGNNIWEMFPKHLGTVLEENFRAAMDKREVRRFEISGKYTDAWYRMTVYPSAEGITVLGRDVTAQKRAEEQLHFHAALLSNVNDAIVASDAQYRITAWNSAAESMYGWTADEVIGQDGLEIMRTEWPAQDADEMRQSIAETGRWRGEATQVRKDGSRFPVEVSSIVLYDDQGQVSGYVSVNRDITERKRMEDEIASMARFPVENPNPILRIQKDGVIAFANTASERLLQFWNRSIGEHLPESEQNLVAQTLESEKMIEQEVECSGRVYSLIFTPIPNAGYVNIYGRDITERNWAKAQLRFALERYETLFNFISEGFAHYKAIYNDAGKLVDIYVIDINPVGALMSGVDREAQIGKTWKQIWPGVEDSLFAAYEQVDRTGQPFRFDHHSPITDRTYQSSVSRIVPGELVVTFFDVTERKEAEKTVARQRELLQRVFDNIPVLLVMWEPALHRFTLNRRAETVLGWTTSDANEGDFMSKVYPDPAYRTEVSAFMQSLSSGFREFYTTSKNGERIPVEWANVRLNDDTMIGIGVDLRERKRAEESLRARTEEIETILQVSPIAFFVAHDRDCTEITANPAGYRLVDLPEDTGANVSKSAPQEQQPSYRVFRHGVELASQELPMQLAARLGIDVVEESLELRFEDGSSKYVYSYARPLIGENGKPRGAIAAMLDITERKLADQKLRESEERFRTLANTVPSFVWTASPDGITLFTNDYWYKYTGANSEEEANDWQRYYHPDDLPQTVAAWSKAVESAGDYSLEVRIRRHDGEYRWFQTRAVPVRDGEGNVAAWYGVTTDIHDRIEALHDLRDSQQQLQFLNESLEQKVMEQTSEIRYLASELTKVEQRERNRIAHVLHDDLQQRLYAVKLRLALLTEGKNFDQTIEKELVEVDKQLSEVLSITRNLTIELSPPVLRDEGLTQALVWLAAQIYERQGMRIEIQADASFAMADEAIQVLLFNCVRELLFNTIKHAGVDSALVSLKRSNDNLVIKVKDDGKGFDMAALEENNKDRPDMVARRVSFGLSTLRHQLNLVGGQMDIQSEPDNGTCVTITIPYS